MAKDQPSVSDLQRAVDERTLLHGEDPDTPYIDDAVHWIRVYGELIPVKLSLLERLEESRHGLTDDAVSDLDVDVRLLRAQADRYTARREYWLQRVKKLGSAMEGPPSAAFPEAHTPPTPSMHVVDGGEVDRG
jgi:hypothetical protein